MNISYIILKHVIWRFQIYNLFLEVCKFREDKNNNVSREILKYLRKTAKIQRFCSKHVKISPYILIAQYCDIKKG